MHYFKYRVMPFLFVHEYIHTPFCSKFCSGVGDALTQSSIAETMFKPRNSRK